MEKIAVLTSTAPLRKTTTRRGMTKQRLNMDAIAELAERFDEVIIGSLTADEVYEYLERHLPREARPRFHLYPRSFFHKFRTEEVLGTTDDPLNVAWTQILSENAIRFEVLRRKAGHSPHSLHEKFEWRHISDFITDERVTLVTGGEGQLFYDSPSAAR
ncbi:MAG TPA: hypothetical protein VMY69_04440 [Phycisphaerae bacterium]|nr:hypothetical protein [Phycisphaerae bacterium]